MKNRMIWGLGILMLLLGIAGIFLLIPQKTDTENVEFKPPSSETFKNIRDKQRAQLPPTSAAPEEGRHKGELHDGPHTKKQGDVHQKGKQATLRSKSSSNSLPFGVTYAELGLEIPPKGYRYVWKEARVPVRDENGEPILLREGEPYIEVLYTTGFAPTPEQLDQYMKLKGKYLAARGWGRTAEAEQLKNEMEEIKAIAQGKVPGGIMMSNGNGGDYSGLRRQKEIEAYRKLGLDYLYEYIVTGQIFH